MNIEILIREMHEDFCKGRTLAFAEKLEFLLEFADVVELYRTEAFKAGPMYGNDYAIDLGFKVFNWPGEDALANHQK